jgi:hypothetical protein
MALKRKVLGLTMLVDKVYSTKHEFLYTKYTFINSVTNYVYNTIMSELSTKYNRVLSDVEDKEVGTDYGTVEVYTGSIRCYN